MQILKIFSIVALLIAGTTSVSAQLWFDIGGKGAYGMTMMLNKNVFDDRQIDHKISWGYGFGGSLGLHFNDHQGIQLEYMRSTGKQVFDDESATPTTQINYEWQTNDFMLLYRYTGYGAFFEIGPKMSMLSSISRNDVDVAANFEDTWYSGVLGFGTYLAGSDVFSIQAGLRLHYQFGDMINEMGQSADFPVGVKYESYKSTSALAAQLHVEINYAFGRFAKESCRDRWKLVLF